MFNKLRDFVTGRRKEIRSHVQWMGLQAPFTPDISELEESQYQLLFACDDLMYAGKNYGLIAENSAKGDRGFTAGKFNFFMDGNGGAVPIMGRKSSVHVPRRIKGEVHVVESFVFPKLDTKYCNGVHFHRGRVQIAVPYRFYEEVNNGEYDISGKSLPPILQGHKYYVSGERVAHLETWMYVGISQYWRDKIDGGYENPQVPIVYPDKPRGWAPSYYQFPKNGQIK